MSFSIFSLSSFCTCRLTRRSMNGFRIMWRRRSWCSFSLLPLFSAAFSMSFENHSLNSSWESNRLGMMKCRRAHNSAFPVSLLIRGGGMDERTLHRVLDGGTSEQQPVATVEAQ